MGSPHRNDIDRVPIFDPDHLANFCESVGREIAPAILAALANDIASLSAKLASPSAKIDPAEARDIAHALRGAALNTGAVCLANAATALHDAPSAEIVMDVIKAAEATCRAIAEMTFPAAGQAGSKS